MNVDKPVYNALIFAAIGIGLMLAGTLCFLVVTGREVPEWLQKALLSAASAVGGLILKQRPEPAVVAVPVNSEGKVQA